MKLRTIFLVLSVLWLIVMLFGCVNNVPLPPEETPTIIPEPTFEPTPSLPEGAKTLLEKAIEKWNESYSGKVEAISWKVKEKILSEEERENILQDITSSDKAYIPKVDTNDTENTEVWPLSHYTEIPEENITSWKTLIDSLLKVGMYVVEITWKYKDTGKTFTTNCITDEESIIYDNILSNTVEVKEERGSWKKIITIYWLWGSERGKITIDFSSVCGEEAIACNCDCDAYMTLGSAKVNCKSKKEEPCCTFTYSYAWGTPLVKIKVSTDNFTLGTSGIGSKGEGTGSYTTCCE